jgi:hypothetical protein
MNDRRMLLVMVLALVVLAGIALLQTNPDLLTGTGSEVDERSAMMATVTAWRGTFLFPDVTVTDIVTINLREPNSGRTFTISRDASGVWTAPGSVGTLDLEAARAIAQTIVLIPYERTVDLAQDASLVEYGFNPNGLMFVEFLEYDESSHIFALGGLTSDRQYYYLLVDERSELFVIPRSPLDFLRQMLSSPPLT